MLQLIYDTPRFVLVERGIIQIIGQGGYILRQEDKTEEWDEILSIFSSSYLVVCETVVRETLLPPPSDNFRESIDGHTL